MPWVVRIATTLNFTHKAACAVVFGTFGLTRASWYQPSMILGLQVCDHLAVLS